MTFEEKLRGMTKSALIDLAHQKYSLFELNTNYQRSFIIKQIIAEEIKVQKKRKAAETTKWFEKKAKEEEKKKKVKEKKKKEDPIHVLKIQLDDIKKNQEKILNDLESKGCLHFLLSNNELQDYARNIGIELNLDQDHYNLMYQIESAEGTLDTSQPKWNFRSFDGIIAKRYRKHYWNKVRQANFANRQLNALKSSQEKIKGKLKTLNEVKLRIKQIQDKEKLEILNTNIQAKAELKAKADAEKVTKKAARKAKEKLKKRFF